MYLTWHLRCSGLKRTEKQDLGEQHRRKAITTLSLIMTSFLMTDQLDPQANTNLFMTRALKRTRGESATHLNPAGIYTCTKRHPRQNARRRCPQPHGQSSRSHRPQEPSQKWPAAGPGGMGRSRAAGTSPYKAVLTAAHAAVHLLPRSPASPQPESAHQALTRPRQHVAGTGFVAPPETTSASIPTYKHRAPALTPLSPLQFISRNLGSN